MKLLALAWDQIQPDPHQPRKQFDPVQQEELAGSLHNHGQLQPVIVFRGEDDRYILVEGHRRHDAARRAGMARLNAIVLEERPNADTLLILQLTANGQRADLKPLEKAEAYQRLKDATQCSNTELAAKLSRSKAHVTLHLSLLRLPEEGRRLVESGKLKASTAYAITREQDPAVRDQMLQQAATGELRRDEAEQKLKRRAPAASSLKKMTLSIGNAVVTVGRPRSLTLDEYVSVLEQALRECRNGRRNGLSLKTLESVLTDRQVTEPPAVTTADRKESPCIT